MTVYNIKINVVRDHRLPTIMETLRGPKEYIRHVINQYKADSRTLIIFMENEDTGRSSEWDNGYYA